MFVGGSDETNHTLDYVSFGSVFLSLNKQNLKRKDKACIWQKNNNKACILISPVSACAL